MRLAYRFSPQILALLAMACLALPARSQVERHILNDFRVYLDFTSGSGYRNDPVKQDEMRRGVSLAFRMWQSVLPDFHYHWVPTAGDANFIVYFGDYSTPAKRAATGSPCPSDVNWQGCGAPWANWYNDAGGMPFSFDDKHFVSRTSIYNAYVPATYPPQEYHLNGGPGLGYTEGRFTVPATTDMATLALHEFAHSLGMQHDTFNAEDFKAWYGPLKTSGGSTPAQPYVVVNQSQYPDLPSTYYGGGTQSSPFVGTLNPVHPMALTHWLGVEYGHAIPKGILWPPTSAYNSRVFFETDLRNTSLAVYKFAYPRISGLIRMVKAGTWETRLTSDWSDALTRTGLKNSNQGDPWYVVDVLPRINAKAKLSTGLTHTLAIRDDGTLWAWGANESGQLGTGNNNASNKPVQVGTLNTWAAVAAGDDFSLALKWDGSLWAWGNNAFGILGNGVAGTKRNTPDKVCKASGPSCYGRKYVAVTAGSAHASAIADDGTLWGWGLNGSGQVGDNSNSNRSYPVQEDSRQTHWVSVSAGAAHTAALDAEGFIWTWGYNGSGQLGSCHYVSRTYPLPECNYDGDWDQVVAGRYFTLARKESGAIYSWGDNGYGVLGIGSVQSTLPFPSPVIGEGRTQDWVQLGAGAWHGGGVKARGQAWTWGSNWSGQLGDNTTSDRDTPGSEIYLGGPEWTSMAMGGYQSFAFKADGSLWGWGDNRSGQLGLGSNTSEFRIPTKTRFSGKASISTSAPTPQTPYRHVATVPIRAEVSDNVSKVEFYSGSTKIGEDLTPPFSKDWTGMTRGVHSLTAKATDQLGTTVTSAPVAIHVHTLSNWSYSTPAAGTVVSLSSTGTLDWMHTGLNGVETNRKNVSNVLTTLSLQGGTLAHHGGSSSNHLGFTWTDGKSGTGLTPSRTTATYNGVKPASMAVWQSFNFAVSVPQANRKLNLYLRATNVDLDIEAILNGSVSTTTAWNNANGPRVYSLTFGSALAPPVYLGVTITVRTLRSGGSLQFMGATVASAP